MVLVAREGLWLLAAPHANLHALNSLKSTLTLCGCPHATLLTSSLGEYCCDFIIIRRRDLKHLTLKQSRIYKGRPGALLDTNVGTPVLTLSLSGCLVMPLSECLQNITLLT